MYCPPGSEEWSDYPKPRALPSVTQSTAFQAQISRMKNDKVFLEVNKWRLPAAASRDAAADSTRFNTPNSLHGHDNAIASS
jgi:hypothetical protein